MCGRYVLTKPAQVVVEHFDLFESPCVVEARYNAAPTDSMPVVVVDEAGHRVMRRMRWGLVPHWAKSPNVGAKMINARSETVGEKPAFRDAIRRRRCLVPADGFYEWKRAGRDKQPYFITVGEQDVYGAAGIWESWNAPTGARMETFAILTVPPNDCVRELHDRMPLILPPESYALWLDRGVTELEAIRPLFEPYDSNAMKAQAVSTRVSSVRNDDPSLLEPVDPGVGKNLELF